MVVPRIPSGMRPDCALADKLLHERRSRRGCPTKPVGYAPDCHSLAISGRLVYLGGALPRAAQPVLRPNNTAALHSVVALVALAVMLRPFRPKIPT